MDVLRDRDWQRPLPAPDSVTAPFWKAASEGRLVFQECPACGHRQYYPRPLCTACGADPEWREASGRGQVHTFTIVRQHGGKPFRDELPYVVAMIDLEEGVRMMGNLTDCDVESVRVGMAVEAYAVAAADEIAVPFWRPA